MYYESLPSTHSLKQLAEMSGPFPIRNRYLLLNAERFGFSRRLMEFLRLFPLHQVFHSRDSFLEHCAELKIVLRSERSSGRDPILKMKGVHYGYYPAGTARQTGIKGGWRNLLRPS